MEKSCAIPVPRVHPHLLRAGVIIILYIDNFESIDIFHVDNFVRIGIPVGVYSHAYHRYW